LKHFKTKSTAIFKNKPGRAKYTNKNIGYTAPQRETRLRVKRIK